MNRLLGLSAARLKTVATRDEGWWQMTLAPKERGPRIVDLLSGTIVESKYVLRCAVLCCLDLV